MRRVLLAEALGLLVGSAEQTPASVLATATEAGGDVVFQGSGTLDLTGLTFFGEGTTFTGVIPSNATLIIGESPTVDNYGFPTTPDSFGAGGATNPSSGSGDKFGIIGDPNRPTGLLRVPAGYRSGDLLSASSTFSGQTFTSLGLTPGVYVYTLPSDTITLQVGPVPEPSTLALAGLGGLGLVGVVRRKRRRTGGVGG